MKLVAGQEESDHKQKELRRQLWRAPELLRSPNPPPQGTQKGDIYSFAIVLYEIMGRSGPWGQIDISHDGKSRNLCDCRQLLLVLPSKPVPIRGLNSSPDLFLYVVAQSGTPPHAFTYHKYHSPSLFPIGLYGLYLALILCAYRVSC